MLDDVTAYATDQKLVQSLRAANPNNKPRWHGSDAERLLKEDVANGKHLKMKPRFLYDSKPEYKVFSLDEFRPHIYQMVDAEPKRAYRFEKKKKGWLYPELHENDPRLKKSDNDS